MNRFSKQQGFTLIEVLTSIVVLSIGLMGIASLSLSNIQTTAFGHTQTQATILAEEIADTMRLNLVAYESNQFSWMPDAIEKACYAGTQCDSSEQAGFDSNVWLQRAAQVLPGGLAVMCMDSTPDDGQPDAPACDGAGMNTVKLFWLDSRLTDGLADGETYYRHAISMIP